MTCMTIFHIIFAALFALSVFHIVDSVDKKSKFRFTDALVVVAMFLYIFGVRG